MGETENDKDNPRRILDVDVREVSLVDRAANLRKFLIIKRLKEEEMGAFQAEVDALLKNEDGGDFKPIFEGIAEVEKALPETEGDPGSFWESDNEEITKALPADLAKAIRDVSAWMKRLSRMKGAPGPAIARVLTFLGKVVGGKYPYPKPVGKAEDIPTEEEAKKALTEELEKAIKSVAEFMAKAANGKLPIPEAEKDEVAKAVPADLASAIKRVVSFLNKVVGGQYPYPKPGAAGGAGGYPAPAKKSDDVADPGADAEIPAVQVMDDGSVIVKGQAVSKGKKFTASRIGAIKDTALQMIKLLGEVGDEDTRKALGDALKALTGAAEPAAQGVQAVGAQKSELEPEVEELRKQLADVTKQLEEVVKERKAGSGIEDGTAAARVEKKEEDGFWGGVI